MSGYLQRLAQNAITPSRSIHPAVGSIFSPPKHEMPAPLMEFEEIETVRNRAESAQVPPAVPRATHTPFSPESEALQGKPSRKEGESRPEAFRPIVPLPRRTTPVVSTPHQTLPQPEELGPLRTIETAQQAGSLVEGAESYTPLIPPNVQPSDAEPELFHPSPSVVSAAPKKDSFAAPRRAVPSGREPDEIQIHIGRIEVTAVPQAEPRPAAVPASKSINLDEYLRRGRGRAR
jgi:hypothetical protein